MVAIVIALSFGGLTGCDSGDRPEDQEKFSATESVPLHRKAWLERQDTVAPELWLASRDAHADVTENHPLVSATRERLDIAKQRFGDSPRMIANRSVQLEGMLSADGIQETAVELLDALASVPGGLGTTGGYGALCQQYYNLRKSGQTREAALDALRARYGSRT
jgi:hypothetical protein